jgi:AcrR family transcriptional regulator
MSEEETRRRILNAAAQFFAEKGFAGAATRQIAAAAGVNEVTLFRHFGTKAALYEETVRRNSALPGMAAAIQSQMTGDYRQDLQILARHFLGFMLTRRKEILSSLCEAERLPELRKLVGSIPAQQRQALSGYLRSQIQRGVVREMDTEMAAQALLGMFLAYAISLSMLPEELTQQPPEEVVAQFLDIFIRGTQK